MKGSVLMIIKILQVARFGLDLAINIIKIVK